MCVPPPRQPCPAALRTGGAGLAEGESARSTATRLAWPPLAGPAAGQRCVGIQPSELPVTTQT